MARSGRRTATSPVAARGWDLDDGDGYIRQLQSAGEVWRLAVYEGTRDCNGDELDRPAIPELRDLMEYEEQR